MESDLRQAQHLLKENKPEQALGVLRPLEDQLNGNSQYKIVWPLYHMMGIGLSQQGNHEASARYMKKALETGATGAETYHMLSVNYFNLAQFDKAEQYGKIAVEQKDDFQKAWLNLGSVYRAQAKLEKALRCFQKVNQLDPTNADVAYRVGKIYRDLGNLEKAHQLFEFTLKIDKNHKRAFLEKADLYKKNGNYDKAEESVIEAREKYGQDTAANIALADIYRAKGTYDEALALYEQLLEEDPTRSMVRINYALALKEVSRFDESEENYRQAIKELPESRIPVSNYLMGLHYNPQNSKEYIFKEHVRLGKRFTPDDSPQRAVPSNVDKDKKLRIGLVSGGFRGHPVGYMIAGALEQLSSEQFDIYCYTNNNKHDFLTQHIHHNIDKWRSIVGYNSKVVDKLIRDDEIDILIELSGHASHSRLETMIREPAPIIVKWVGGLFNTTGIEAFDYLISDWYETPEGEEDYYTEKLVRLPNDYISYKAPSYMPDIAPLPASENDYITFGCFNNPTKVNEVVLKHWADIMLQVPKSKLFLKSKQYDTPSFRNQVTEVLVNCGISEDRIKFAGQTAHDDHLETYNTIDIAFDPWPYSGGLTTCEALYIGVPVITMPGPTFAGRHSATHLINAGLEQWVTASWDEYSQKAIALATNWDELQELRSTLREKVRNSPLCDGKRFGAHLSVAFRKMWEQWVAGYKNNMEDWQEHISVEPLSDSEIRRLTDGPDQIRPIEVNKKRNMETDITKEKQNNVQDSNPMDKDSGTLKQEKESIAVSGVDNQVINQSDKTSRKKTCSIKTKDGLTICTPADFDLLTPYVMLEQEEWFEPELDFVRQYLEPGMQVLDAGAGFGAYTLPMSKRVKKDGKVYAFEPGPQMNHCLEMSKRENGLDQIEIIRQGLGAKAGKAYLKETKTPELNFISNEGKKEISLTTLDAWWSFAGRPELDLIKMDVNGMEADLLKGSAKVLDETDPIIISPVEDEKSLEKLREQFKKRGYHIFEYIPGLALLADYDGRVNAYLMNIIAVKESQIEELKERGWIYKEDLSPAEAHKDAWKQILNPQPWTDSQMEKWEDQISSGQHEKYLQALNLISTAERMEVNRSDSRSRSLKSATMLAAAQKLISLFNGGQAGVAAAITYVRVMNQLGKRLPAAEMMKELIEMANSGDDYSPQLPFLLPLSDQDSINVQTNFDNWLMVRLVEAWIMLKDPTTYVSGEQEQQMLDALKGNPENSQRLTKCIRLLHGEESEILEGSFEDQEASENGSVNKRKGISIVENVNVENENLPSQLVKTRIELDYLKDDTPLYFLIPKRELFRLKNIFLDHEYSLPNGFEVPDNGVIVDVGANIGTFAIYARQWNPTAHIYSFEPNPQVKPLLNSNTSDIQNITIDFVALGASDGELTLMQHPVNTGQSSTSQKIKGAKKVNTKVKEAGKALTEKGIDKIDVLKIDTEGAEVAILKGMQNLLEDTKVIMLEYHTEEDRREIDALLSNFCLYSSEVAMINGIGTVKYINRDLLR